MFIVVVGIRRVRQLSSPFNLYFHERAMFEQIRVIRKSWLWSYLRSSIHYRIAYLFFLFFQFIFCFFDTVRNGINGICCSSNISAGVQKFCIHWLCYISIGSHSEMDFSCCLHR